MSDRYAENIRRIVLDEIVTELKRRGGSVADLTNDKDGLPGSRGIGYQSSSEETGGASGGNVYNPLGTTVKDPSDGSSDSENTGVASASDVISNSTDLGSDIANALAGMDDMTDPNTGDDMQINFNGQFNPVKEQYGTDGTYTPDWPDPEDPPELDNWELGTEWYINIVGASTNPAYHTATPQEQAAKGVAYFNDAAVGGQTDWTFVGWADQAPTQWTGNYKSAGTTNTGQISHRTQLCITGSKLSCPLTAPTAESWPEDDKINFKLENGKFKTSHYDPEQPINYNSDASKVEFNYGSGQTGAVEVTKDGGFAMYETRPVDGAAIGTVRKYNSQGVYEESFPASQLGDYLPG